MFSFGVETCSTCGFNRALKYINGLIQTIGRAFCAIRELPIRDPLRTSCFNWYSFQQFLTQGIPTNIMANGPLFALGRYEVSNCSIPWHDTTEPRINISGQCFICGDKFTEGIEVAIEKGRTRAFCCCAHYVQWWQRFHPDIKLPKDYDIGYAKK